MKTAPLAVAVAALSSLAGAWDRPTLVQRALESNRKVQIQSVEEEKARIEERQVWANYLPKATLTATWTRINDPVVLDPAFPALPTLPGMDQAKTEATLRATPMAAFAQKYPLTTAENAATLAGIEQLKIAYGLTGALGKLFPLTLQEDQMTKATLQVTQPLFTGLKIPALARAVQHKRKALQAMEGREKTTVTREVLETWDRIALVDQSAVVLDSADHRLEEEDRRAQAAFRNGLIPSFDLTRIAVARKDLEARRIEVDGKRELLLQMLEQVSGVPVDSLRDLHPQLTLWMVDTADTAVERRFEAVALNEAVQAAQARSRSTVSAFLPTAFAFWKQELLTDDLSLFEPEWAVGVGVKWELFNGLQDVSERRKALLDERVARLNEASTRSLLRLGRTQAQTDYRVALKLIDVAREKEAQAATGLSLATRRYQAGLSTVNERLEAEQEYQAARLGTLQAVCQQRQAAARVLEATGRLTVEQIAHAGGER